MGRDSDRFAIPYGHVIPVDDMGVDDTSIKLCIPTIPRQASWLGALLSSIQVAAIYRPVRKWVEKWINTRFYKDRIDPR